MHKRRSVSSRDVSPKMRELYNRFRRRGFSHADSTRLARDEMSMVGHIGDVNWLDHGGGPVYKTDDGYWLEYVEPPPEDARKRERVWTIYRMSLPDPEGIKDWLRRGEIQKYTGVSNKEFLAALRSKNPIAEAQIWSDIASYYGWHELDHYPLTLNKEEVTLRYGEEPSDY